MIMKTLIVLAMLFFFCLYSNGQEEKKTKFFLNSKQFDIDKNYINPKNIDSIKINKETVDGEIYLYTNPQKLPLISLENILIEKAGINKIDHNLLVRIDGKYINDIEEIKIDKSYFIYIDVKEVSDIKYISDKYKGLKIVEIELESKERKPKIYIRGDREYVD